MSDAIITVEGLGKKYRLGQRSNERYKALRDVLTEKAQGIFKRGRNGQSAKIDNEILASLLFRYKQTVIGIL